jgi:hypothetical protein
MPSLLKEALEWLDRAEQAREVPRVCCTKPTSLPIAGEGARRRRNAGRAPGS